MNNRDHRKIVIIDGHTAFTGGINLADEYINEKNLYGHWKDNGIMVKGSAVFSFSLMFLSVWDYYNNDNTNYYKYKKDAVLDKKYEDSGYVVPFLDSPIDNEPPQPGTGRNPMPPRGLPRWQRLHRLRLRRT